MHSSALLPYVFDEYTENRLSLCFAATQAHLQACWELPIKRAQGIDVLDTTEV